MLRLEPVDTTQHVSLWAFVNNQGREVARVRWHRRHVSVLNIFDDKVRTINGMDALDIAERWVRKATENGRAVLQ